LNRFSLKAGSVACEVECEEVGMADVPPRLDGCAGEWTASQMSSTMITVAAETTTFKSKNGHNRFIFESLPVHLRYQNQSIL
jgi:hypothetical protein